MAVILSVKQLQYTRTRNPAIEIQRILAIEIDNLVVLQ
jgi:hypothetical protein